MKIATALALFGLLITSNSFAALMAGDAAPYFKIPASFAGKSIDFSLEDQLKKGTVVVYFYPSAYTNGCNIQAYNFSVNSAKFAAAGASIIGISLDSIDRLNKFSADPEYCAGKFPVASDSNGKVSKAYALNIKDAMEGKLDTRGENINHGFAERTTFVITPDGKIAAAIGGLTPAENVVKTLEFVQTLPTKK